MDLRKCKPAQPTEELVIQARREHHSKADAMLWTICTKKEGFPVCVLWLLGKVVVALLGRRDVVGFWSLKNGYSDLVAISRVNQKPEAFGVYHR
jgi:hypothetical protein